MHVHECEQRRWRHLYICQFKTVIVARVPRVSCCEHGTQTVAVPWAEKFGRFSRLFERLAIDLMLECSVKAACQILRISWDETDGIKQPAVVRGLERKKSQPIKRLGVDEKTDGRGQDHVTVVARLVPGQPATVEYVGDGRKQQALDAFWESFPKELAAPDVPLLLRSDHHRLRQVLVNLAGNAIKFTRHGEVVVRVSVVESHDDGVQLRLSMRDTGIGIAPDKLHLLFNEFSQVDTSVTRQFGGSGLGLAIPKPWTALKPRGRSGDCG